MKSIIILYHSDCPDGFGGAWSAWKKFGNDASYIPAKHRESPSSKLKGKEIYLLDFTYFGKDLKTLAAKNKKVVIIDHHITAKTELKNVHESFFDLKRSGAGLAWRYFHKNKKIPALINYVEDQDLWLFKMPQARAVMSAINLKPQNFEVWNVIARELEMKNGWQKYAEKGETIIEYENKTIAELIKKIEPATFHGHRAGVINSPILQSEIGHAIYSSGFLIAIVWSRQSGQIKVSLRSKKINVAKLAEKYGGGGHRAAAGFKLAGDKKMPWRYTKRNG